ncbi:MAG: HEAT repeat domain-containing protein [Candidatus Sericytochromatia bacterium]
MTVQPEQLLQSPAQGVDGLSAESRQRLVRWIQQLGSEDLDILNDAVQQLSLQSDAALPLLLEALLTAEEEEIRKNAAWVLGFLHRSEAILPLFQVLSSDASTEVRLSASWALRQLDLQALAEVIFAKLEPPQNFDDVLAYLRSKSWKARWYCTVLLTFQQSPACLDALLDVAASDQNVIVRCSAILSLTAYQDERIPGVLTQLLSDIDDFVKIEAATVLSLKQVRTAIPDLARQLQAYSENVRVSVVAAIGALGDIQVIPHLAKALKDPSDLVRINAAMALFDVAQRLKKPHVNLADICLKALRDPNVYVVKNAARTLGLVGTEDALREIISLLKQESQPAITANLVQALGLFKDRRALKILSRLLRHASWEVRFEVVQALSQLKDPGVYPLLLQALRDPSVTVKEQAIRALGAYGNVKAIAPLEKIKMQHPYGSVNKSISEAIDKLLGMY